MNQLQVLFRLKRKLEAWYADTDLKVLILDYCPAESKTEDGKTYHYPETMEVKFENQANTFYSFRLSDGKFIREGLDMVASKGLTAAHVYKLQANEAKSRRKVLAVSKRLAKGGRQDQRMAGGA